MRATIATVLLLVAVCSYAPQSRAQTSNAPASAVIMPLYINSPVLDYAPTITADGRTLYFVSNRIGGEGGHDIWRSQWIGGDDGGFEAAVNIGSAVNTQQNEGVTTIAADGRTLFFTGCNRIDGVGDCDIYVAELSNGAFVNVRNLRNVNSPFWDTEPTVTADGRSLYFISNRPGGLGGIDGIDIWYSTLDDDENWSEPQNLGTPINTSLREDSPFLHPSGELLYFSSNGHAGARGLDFMVSLRTLDGWSRPVNIGAPINTARDERFITTPEMRNEIYFSSDRTDVENLGMLDLYVAIISPEDISGSLRGRVLDARTLTGVVASMQFTNVATGERIATQQTPVGSGAYLADLRFNAPTRVAVSIQKSGYASIFDTLLIPTMFSSYQFDVDYHMHALGAVSPDRHDAPLTQLAMSPNPASRRVSIIVIGDASSNARHELRCFDTYGSEVTRATFTGEHTTLDVSQFASGPYIIWVDGRTSVLTVRR